MKNHTIRKIVDEEKDMRREEVIYALAKHIHPSKFHKIVGFWNTENLRELLQYYKGKRITLIVNPRTIHDIRGRRPDGTFFDEYEASKKPSIWELPFPSQRKKHNFDTLVISPAEIKKIKDLDFPIYRLSGGYDGGRNMGKGKTFFTVDHPIALKKWDNPVEKIVEEIVMGIDWAAEPDKAAFAEFKRLPDGSIKLIKSSYNL